MHRGRFQLGDRVTLSVWCRNGSDTPTLPDNVPVAIIFADSAKADRVKLPIVDRYTVTGFFAWTIHLDAARFAAGRYRVVYDYILGGTRYGEVDEFEVVAGGDADGTVIALTVYNRPHASFLVQQLDSGKLIRGRNPKV